MLLSYKKIKASIPKQGRKQNFRGTTHVRHKAALKTLNARPTPVIGRSSRANQAPVLSGAFSRRLPISEKNSPRYFPVLRINRIEFITVIQILQELFEQKV